MTTGSQRRTIGYMVKKAPPTTRDARVTVRLPTELRDRLERAAQRDRRTLASWIVLALESAVASAEKAGK